MKITTKVFFGREMKVFENASNNVYELFQKSVSLNPEKEAIVWDSVRISYNELAKMTENFGANLQTKLTINKGDKIATLINNRPEFCISLLSLAGIGGIVVPLNTRLNQNEWKKSLQDAEVSVLIIERRYYEMVQDVLQSINSTIELIVINDGDEAVANAYTFDELLVDIGPMRSVEVNPEDTLFIMYTSGTTGRPKGAIGTHLGVVQNVISYQDKLKNNHNERALVNVPLFHVTGLLGNFLYMISIGGTTVLLYTFKTKLFFELMEKEKITYLVTVPTIYVFLLNYHERDNYDLSNWRYGLYGGAPMAEQTIKEMLKHYPQLKLVNTYGATESTGSTTFTNPETPLHKASSVGEFTKLTEWKIMNDEGVEAQTDEVGEVWLRGPHITPGYWGNLEATMSELSEGYWKSGDLGYIDSEGYFYIMDRKKSMINRGGEKIFCAEIENVLYNHPKIFEAAVVGVPDKVMGEEVMVVLVLKADEVMLVEEVKSFIKQSLADYKVPQYVRFVKELPRNPSGKILKQPLKDLIN